MEVIRQHAEEFLLHTASDSKTLAVTNPCHAAIPGTVSLFGGSEASQKEVLHSVPEVAGGVLFPRVCGLQLRGVWQSMDVVDKSLLPAPARGLEIRFTLCVRPFPQRNVEEMFGGSVSSGGIGDQGFGTALILVKLRKVDDVAKAHNTKAKNNI